MKRGGGREEKTKERPHVTVGTLHDRQATPACPPVCTLNHVMSLRVAASCPVTRISAPSCVCYTGWQGVGGEATAHVWL